MNLRALTPILIGAACAILGFLAGWDIYGQPTSMQDSVPADALNIAQIGGEEILRGTPPDTLSLSLYTRRFTQQYAVEYSALIQPMSTDGTITWTGTPVVTWSGGNYIDTAMTSRTQAGIVMLELRLVHQGGNDWAIDQLLSIQLKEPAQ